MKPTTQSKSIIKLTAILFLFQLSLLVLALPKIAKADECPSDVITISTRIPGMPKCTSSSGEMTYVPNLQQYIYIVYNFALGTAGIFATVMVVFGGFLYITAAGNPTRIEKAKEYITSALIGLVLTLGAYTILNFINPRLVILELPGVSQVGTTIYVPQFCEKASANPKLKVEGTNTESCGFTLDVKLADENSGAILSKTTCISSYCADKTKFCVARNTLQQTDAAYYKEGYVCK